MSPLRLELRLEPGYLAQFGFGLLAAGGLLAASSAAAAQPGPAAKANGRPIARTTAGLVQGKATGAMNEFLGIPYAAPPVGRLRWRPPQPPAHWSGLRTATAFAPHCPQPPSQFGQASTSENCLFLNVFAPAPSDSQHGRSRSLPVMVWIHGGTLLVGESDDFNPAGLVRHGVIVVTINYRLGALGFLADAALAQRPDGPTGDYGLLDQQAALRWVQHNIANFGGDRNLQPDPGAASDRRSRRRPVRRVGRMHRARRNLPAQSPY